ncbi:unnamed protein product [Rhizoctonia solani]|uniref:Heat shock 70 kDa protein 12A n=1 Tax=Rhizoctonia solani TaxID=456999 RepID=A0A8H3GUS3_9AGAM|nr:unnamed protein product [Rhizoctonia solani]
MDTNNARVPPIYRTFQGLWQGESRIVLGIDIGTTYSGVAFTYLSRGSDQLLHRVDRWPGQEGQNYSGKIPSIIWYDSNGKATSFGAEALTHDAQDEAEDAGWELAQHFKLQLHPASLRSKHNIAIDVLPSGVSLKQVYSDFLGYLLQHTKERFEEVVPDGRTIWQSYSDNMDVIIAHPNGWGIREQAFLREAVLTAGFTARERANAHVLFVTEAEASVHFCMHYSGLRGYLKASTSADLPGSADLRFGQPGTNFAVCDAGGSTVDTTLYTVESESPNLQLSEKRASACVQSGAIFVDQRAEVYLRQHFEQAGLSAEQVDEYVTTGIQDFKSREKLRFNGVTELRIKVTSARIRDERIGVRGGALKLSGAIVQSNIFDHCVNDIVASVDEQLSLETVTHLLLVGGFGTNPYLYQRLKSHLDHTGCEVTTPNEATSKAVADGALIWHCANIVTKRVPRLAYGVGVAQKFDPNNREHCRRRRSEHPDGCIRVGGYWSLIVAKGVPVDCESYSRSSYSKLYDTPRPDLSAELFRVPILSRASSRSSKWITTPSGKVFNMYKRQLLTLLAQLDAGFNDGFNLVCTAVADLEELRNALVPRENPLGVRYWVLHFDVCIRFGRTELGGFLEWEENGEKKTGPATMVSIPDNELS